MIQERDWNAAGRSEVALITNHGYAGVDIPLGGAPDTGGQNFYVNQLAAALERHGYAVTVFARGGFPFFGEDRIREGSERLSVHARYVYVPGGGDAFIRKEDIAVALDEQVEWLDAFVRQEARRRGCRPWEVYDFINTHYWDAAVMGVRLVGRWVDDLAADLLGRLLSGVVGTEHLEELEATRHERVLGGNPALALGSVLLEQIPRSGDPAERAGQALRSWGARGPGEVDEDSVEDLVARIRGLGTEVSPALLPLHSGLWIGRRVLEMCDRAGIATPDFSALDRHVWTPHSLGELKDYNYRDKAAAVRRDLKFCERRDHEQVVCDLTSAFAATSAEIAEVLVSHHGVPAEAIFYFPPCVDRSLFRPYTEAECERSYAYLARSSGVPVRDLERGRLVFETSRMDRTKRKDLILESFALAAADLEDTYLFIGGGPENRVFAELEDLRRSDPVLERRAFLLGFIPDEEMYPLFSMADVFVTPSEMEGFGMSASQAAAAGTALVASDLVPFATLFVPEDARVVPAGDVDGFAAALRDLLLDDEDRRRRAERLARRTGALDWDVQTGMFLSHLTSRGILAEEHRRET